MTRVIIQCCAWSDGWWLVAGGVVGYGPRMFSNHAATTAVVFAVAGAACRFKLRYVETRWQIAAFWVVVLAYQFVVQPSLGRPIDRGATVLDLAAVTVAIIAMKVAIEGKITH